MAAQCAQPTKISSVWKSFPMKYLSHLPHLYPNEMKTERASAVCCPSHVVNMFHGGYCFPKVAFIVLALMSQVRSGSGQVYYSAEV